MSYYVVVSNLSIQKAVVVSSPIHFLEVNRAVMFSFVFRSVSVQTSIGLYRENAIAIQNESGDSNGGNV